MPKHQISAMKTHTPLPEPFPLVTFAFLFLLSFAMPHTIPANEEIGFIETYALAEDRTKALEQLIPGTEDFYYFSALHAQVSGDLEKVDTFLEPWIKRYGETQRVQEIKNRQALIQYSENPKETLDYLRRVLGLQFNHRQQKLGERPNLPTELDPAKVSWEAFRELAFRDSDTLSQVSDRGLDRIIRDDLQLDEKRRRDLLSRLVYPDYERLVGLIAADLRTRESQGFGEFTIHNNLLPEQLNELAGLSPQLEDNENFVNAKIRKLRPGEDVDLDLNRAARGEYLNRLWDYVKTLRPSFNSLKAHALFQLLEHHRDQGEYPRELFLTYVKLPRAVSYVEPKYAAQPEFRSQPSNLGADFNEVTLLPPVGDDEALVREYLLHFFVEDESYEGFAPFIRDSFLKPIFAEAKLVNGVGDPEKWYSLISPTAVQDLKERVDIDFAKSNPENFSPADDVSLSVYLKNVSDLLVKVYEINTENYYLDRKREINTDLNLDGLIANEEKSYQYDVDPIRRTSQTFAFDSLKGRRGVWVIEFIGNGMSSRALIRKGNLQLLTRTTAAGAIATVLDGNNQKVEKASIRFGGKEYKANEKGAILLPFSTQGRQSVIVFDGDFAVLDRIQFPRENYQLDAGFHLEREALIPGREIEIAVKPVLRVNGEPASVDLLENVNLVISTTDIEGIESVNTVKDFQLFNNREAVHSFRVPSRVRLLTVELEGEVSQVSGESAKAECYDTREFLVNAIDETPLIADTHLGKFDGKWIVEVVGKSGEPLPDRAAHLTFKHRDFHRTTHATLKTGQDGRIVLGDLEGIEHLSAKVDGLADRSWTLPVDRHTLPAAIHAKAGDIVEIPLARLDGDFSGNDFAIFETRDGNFVSNEFAKATYANGLIQLKGLPAGDYTVYLRGIEESVRVRVTDATISVIDYALSNSRHLQLNYQKPLQISEAGRKGDLFEVSLSYPDDATRVHIIATRYVPQFDPFNGFDTLPTTSPFAIARGSNESLFVSGRDIGEEYRYILERRSSKKFPGNQLKRPGLLLNPWEVNDTNTVTKDAEAGEAYRKSKDKKEGAMAKSPIMEPAAEAQMANEHSPNLDFFAQQAFVAYNLKPDENGALSFDIAELEDRQHVHIVAVNSEGVAYRNVSLPSGDEAAKFRDLRLQFHLDLEKHFTQQRNVTLLNEGDSLKIPDLRASEMETYDTLAAVHGTMSGVQGNVDFNEFSFVLSWRGLDQKRKQELYSEYASHELNFFLSKKDPQFFEAVIQPYLKNKRDKTFMDHYLIGSDLKEFTQPWKFGRLNMVERILLARRLGGDEPAIMKSHVENLAELIPVDVEKQSWFFRSALRGRRAAGGVGGAPDMAALGILHGGMADVAFDAPRPAVAPAARGMRMRALSKSAVAAGKEVGRELPMLAGAAVEMKVGEQLAQLKADHDDNADRFGAVLEEELGDIEALRDLSRKEQLFRKLESTKEWAENNYYHRLIAEQDASLITVNDFWKDFAAWDGKGGFYSRNFPAATNSFAEMMLALAVLDLPFDAKEHDFTIEENEFTIKAKSPVIVFHEEIEEAPLAEDRPPILVSQNFFRNDDRQRVVQGETVDKFVTDEFLTGVLYGSQIVVTNPTSSSHKLDLLLQIPQGALPANGSDYTRTVSAQLNPFSTQKVETFFYFPQTSGDEVFGHYPVHVAKNEKLIAWADPFDFKVVDKLRNFDKASWEYLSQFGTDREVLEYLKENNPNAVDLGRIAWRARERVDFFREVTALLERNHVYDGTLWSYGIYHNQLRVARQYLLHREDFLTNCGKWLECELVSIEPVERHWYQHLEYSPLVNARAHQLGRDRKILNDRFRSQYQNSMKVLSYRPELDSYDQLGTAYYLFLQDRVEEGLAWLEKVKPQDVDTRLQLDYLDAYASLYRGEPQIASQMAQKYADHPVDRWREKFARISEQVKEMGGADLEMTDEKDREQQQDALAGDTPSIALTTEGRKAKLVYQNIGEVTVNYYEMDLEFLFSSKPFVSGGSGQFSYIRPNTTEKKTLPEGGNTFEFEVPEQFASKNVLVEVVGGGETRSSAVYSNSLRVQFAENYGRVQVLKEDDGKPMSTVYVKVYARNSDGSVKFFKDGYTDLRGKFDYVSLNTNELDRVEKLSVLVMSEENGSLVQELAPPQR